MIITDDRYHRLLTALVDQHAHDDAVDRAITETRIQVALCDAGVFPGSSEE